MLPGTIQHALCVTDDEGAALGGLQAVLGLPPGSADLSWEPGSPALIGTILGASSAGTIEIEPLPAELRDALEVLAVEADDERREQQHGGDDREALHHLVLVVGDLGLVVVAHTGEQVA